MYEFIDFIDLNDAQKEIVFKWRNDERVAKFMLHKNISLDEHLKFLNDLKTKSNKKYFLIKMGGGSKYIGVIDFVNIDQNSCEFGIYANPELKSQGKILMQLMINYAKNTLCVKQIKGYAYNFNQKAIALYEKFGFKIVAKDSDFTHFCLDLNH